MDDNVIARVRHLPDRELLAQVKLLARHEREATVNLIAHLAVLSERRLFLGEGFASLFMYCTQVLHLTEHAAYNRIEVARAALRFPIVLSLLADGSVNMTTVRLLAPHLSPANHHDLLSAARHKGKREIEELVAQLHPQPSVPSTVRMLPIERSAATGATKRPANGQGAPVVSCAPADGESAARSAAAMDGPCAAVMPPPPTARTHPAVIEPLGSRRYRVQFTATAETRDKLRLAQDLLRHQIPTGDVGQIVDRALTALLEKLAKRKFAAADQPRTPAPRIASGGAGSRHIPAQVKRAVWLRDGGRCAFAAPTGRRCDERGFLEFHHVVPYAAGGEARVDNIQLRCRAHNGHEADLFASRQAALTPDRRPPGCFPEMIPEPGALKEVTPPPRAGPR